MAGERISAFEIVLLIVGIVASFLGFHLINRAYIVEKEITWMMIIAIFNWLVLLVLFVSLSLAVDISKRHLSETKRIVELLSRNKGRK